MDKLGIEPVDIAHDTALKRTIQPTESRLTVAVFDWATSLYINLGY